MRIGVLGATGPAGRGLAVRLASVGYEVVIGSRSKYRAMEVVDGLHERWPDRDLPIEAADNEGAAAADVVVIATPWDAAAATAESVADALAGKVVISHGQRPGQGRPRVPAPRPAPGLGGGQRPGRGAPVAAWPPPSTTCRPRSWATSPTRSSPTCWSAPTTRRPPRPTIEIVATHPGPAGPRLRRAVQRRPHRGLRRRAAPGQRPLQDPGRHPLHRPRRRAHRAPVARGRAGRGRAPEGGGP